MTKRMAILSLPTLIAALLLITNACTVTLITETSTNGRGGGGGTAGGGAAGSFEWTGSSSIGFGGGVDVTDGSASTESKLLEVNFELDKGNGNIDADNLADAIRLEHSWGSATPQYEEDDKEGVNYDQSQDYSPTFAEINETTGKIDTRFVINLKYGWNKLIVRGKVVATDAKGNENVREITEGPTYIFGNFGAPIPMLVTLGWAPKENDLDMIIHEKASDKWIYWQDMGYGEARCFSADDQKTCYKTEGYVTGIAESRRSGYSYGSLDKDDTKQGGEEVYTLDPPGNENLPGEYADGTEFDVYVNFFEARPEGAEANGVVSVYLSGSQSPEACLQTGSINENPTKLEDTDAVSTADGMILMGTLTMNGGRPYWQSADSAQQATEREGFCYAAE